MSHPAGQSNSNTRPTHHRTTSSTPSSSSSSSRRFDYHSRPIIPILIPSADTFDEVVNTPTSSAATQRRPASDLGWFVRQGHRFVLIDSPASNTSSSDIQIVIAEAKIEMQLMIKEVVLSHASGARFNIPYAIPLFTRDNWHAMLRDYDTRTATELQVPERSFKFIGWSAAKEPMSDLSGPAKEKLKHYLTGLLNIKIENIEDWDIVEWGITPKDGFLVGQTSPTWRRNWQSIVGGFEYKR